MATRSECVEYELFKKHSAELAEATLHPEETAAKLSASNIIDQITYNKVCNDKDTGSFQLMEAVKKYLYCRRSRDSIKKSFQDILNIFKQYVPLDTVVETIEAEYSGGCSSHSDDEDERDQQAKSDSSNSSLDSLTAALCVYSSDLTQSDGNATTSALALIKLRIENHIKILLESGLKKEDVSKQLTGLASNALIPVAINQWCFDKLDEVYFPRESSPPPPVTSSCAAVGTTTPPLFSEDTVYHAALCCLLVGSSEDERRDILSQFGHKFNSFSFASEDCSISISQVKDIIYIALSDMDCESGLVIAKDQLIHTADRIMTNAIGIRFLCELINQGKRLIFTGYGIDGGMPAWSVLYKLWALPYFSADILHNNVAAIVFSSYPWTAVVEDASSESVHSIYVPADFTYILGSDAYIFETILEWYGDEDEFTSLVKEHGLNYDFKEPGLSAYKHYLMSMDENQMDAFKVKLTGCVFDDYCRFNYYLLKGSSESDTLMEKVEQLRGLVIDYLTDPNKIETMAEMSMMDYMKYIQCAYLSKHHQFVIPQTTPQELPPFDQVIPSVSQVVIDCHSCPTSSDGVESTITIKGDHLWFCERITMSLIDGTLIEEVEVCLEDVSRRLYQCEFINHFNLQLIKSGCECLVLRIYSRFQEPIIATVPMKINDYHSISYRQSQLAKQSPSQIIQLAFLSALLEVAPTEEGNRLPSQRYQQIAKFLQEVSQIVPMESIFYAIATCTSTTTANKCINALHSAAPTCELPTSKLMVSGCEQAVSQVVDPRLIKKSHDWRKKIEAAESACHSADTDIDMLSTEVQNQYHFDPAHPESVYFLKLLNSLGAAAVMFARYNCLTLITGRNIGELYPIAQRSSFNSAMMSLPDILRKAKFRLSDLSRCHRGNAETTNRDMLDEVNRLISNDLEPCVTMLGGFMEQQIKVPLVNNPLDTARAIQATKSSGSVGVWALFTLEEKDILNILSSNRNSSLVIQIDDFIPGALSNMSDATPYDAKLQFLVQGMDKTVTCGSHYISYTLERELVSLCNERSITTSTRIDDICRDWNRGFKDTAFSLVPTSYRSLLARWLIWALRIHELREGLALYTTVGVIGLVNSGKSTLVQKIFKRKTVSGTAQAARTTVPFIYNLDDCVEKLCVIDFPGVDDRDESIPELADLLVKLAQIIVFVCSYDKFHTASANDWMKKFEEFSNVPVLVCLTHADRLYEEKYDGTAFPWCPVDQISNWTDRYKGELQSIIGNCPQPRKCTIKFCTLNQSKFSHLNSYEGRKSMRNVGMYTPDDIGEWIVKCLRDEIEQTATADKLALFLSQTREKDVSRFKF